MTSSKSAASRTERASGPLVAKPAHASPIAGAIETRPRDGLMPTRPQQAAGIRIEPPPSLPSAIEFIPAARETAAPPLEPPAVYCGFHGLRAVGHKPPSVTGRPPNSGIVVLPSRMPPAAAMRDAYSWSVGGMKFS